MTIKRYIIALLILFSILNNSIAQFHTIKPSVSPTFRIVLSHKSKQDSTYHSTMITDTTSVSTPYEGNGKLTGFSPPLDCPIVVHSKYGYRIDPFNKKRRFHSGIDLRSNASLVLSMLGGKVKKTGYEKKGLGNYITLRHGDFEVTYGHLSSIFVEKEDIVAPGTPLGVSGSSGRSTGDHLHLTLKLRGKKVDPLPLLLFIQRRRSKIDYNKTL